jgi:hypothetical protein
VREVKSKVLVIAVALLAVAMLATPVMSISPNKIEVEFDGIITDASPPELVWLHGDVQHGRNGWIFYEDCSIMGDGVNLVGGSMSQIADYDINVKGVEPTPPPPPIFRYGKGVMHYRLNLTFADGSFIGSNTLHGEFRVSPLDTAALWNGGSHALLRGTGAYAGWTWVFTAETVNGVADFEAYMIIAEPKLP